MILKVYKVWSGKKCFPLGGKKWPFGSGNDRKGKFKWQSVKKIEAEIEMMEGDEENNE